MCLVDVSKKRGLPVRWTSLAAAAVVMVGAAYWLTQGRPALSFRSRDSVLIADLENQTGDRGLPSLAPRKSGSNPSSSRGRLVF